jgi:hypothetical protein
MNRAGHKPFADLLILSLFLAALFGFKLGERALWSPVEGHYAESRGKWWSQEIISLPRSPA